MAGFSTQDPATIAVTNDDATREKDDEQKTCTKRIPPLRFMRRDGRRLAERKSEEIEASGGGKQRE